MKKPEILAPAGAKESLIAAVRTGANAVYLGASGFNARASATNFDEEELKEAVTYCHLRGVKVYQTLNTVVFDRELAAVKQQITASVEAGVDALIVQDLGVIEMARALAPEIDLHGSTQMSIMNKQGLEAAKQLGLTRVVLARELTRKEIADTKYEGIETEIFVHGALCMSVSGQCYMSVTIGGKSGNRGRCAQPCRLPFAAQGGCSHGLSLRDLSLVSQMQELCELDVASLKIEGRMKRPEYVAAATTACRMALAGEEPDMEMLEAVFSRSGFTDGYFNNKIDAEMFGIRTREDVLAATDAHKNAAQLYREEYPSVPLQMVFTMTTGEYPTLQITDCDGNTVHSIGAQQVQEAINKPTDEERVLQALGKLGGTPYFIEKLDCVLSENGMLPVSALNAVRRDALEQLDLLRIGKKKPLLGSFDMPVLPKINMQTQPVFRARLVEESQLSAYIVDACDKITMPNLPLLKAVSDGKIPPEKAVVEIPRILFPSEHTELEAVLLKLRELGVSKAWCGNLGAITLAKRLGFMVIGGFSLNCTNSLALKSLAALGVQECELSVEISLADARAIAPSIKTGLFAYGYLPAMTFRNCPIQAAKGCAKCDGNSTLTDRMGIQFKVGCKSGTPELFNSVPLYLADRVPELCGFDFLTLYFTDESAEQVENIVKAYQNQTPTQKEKTRGIYYRGLTE